MTEHLLLLDASGFAHAAYHQALPRYTDAGLPTWAILGFAALVWRMLGAAEADRPTLGAAVFDAPGANFRHKLYPDYKAHRGERAEELTIQLPYLRHVAKTLGLTPIEHDGFEADDVVATLAHRAKKAGIRTTIVSADKDFLQCVEDGVIEVVVPRQGRVLSADVVAKWEVRPDQFRDFQALCGDAVDNIPGIPGCGKKKAAALIKRFGRYKEAIDRANECKWPLLRTNLKKYAADAHLSYKLVTLRKNVPLDIDLQSLTMPRPQISHLKDLLEKFEATAQLTAIFNLDPQLARPCDRVADPYEWYREEMVVPGQRIPDLPQCGYFRRRLVKGGALVPARIWREPEIDIETAEPTGRDVLLCEVNGARRDPNSEWMRLATQPIKESEYRFEVADCAHAKRYRPNDPKATPHKRVRLIDLPSPHNPRTKKS